MQTVHQARIEQANGSGRAGAEERVLPDHKASLQAKDAELQVHDAYGCTSWQYIMQQDAQVCFFVDLVYDMQHLTCGACCILKAPHCQVGFAAYSMAYSSPV